MHVDEAAGVCLFVVGVAFGELGLGGGVGEGFAEGEVFLFDGGRGAVPLDSGAAEVIHHGHSGFAVGADLCDFLGADVDHVALPGEGGGTNPHAGRVGVWLTLAFFRNIRNMTIGCRSILITVHTMLSMLCFEISLRPIII